MEWKFHKQFYRIQPEVSIVDLSCMYQQKEDLIENYKAQFKVARNKFYLDISEREFIKILQGGLSYKLKKKLKG